MRSRFLLGVTMAAALGACSLAAPDPLAEAAAAVERQDYFAAHDLVQEVLERDGSDAAAHELLARIQLAMGAGGDALATLDRLEEAGAAPDDAPLLRAEALLQSGDIEEALVLLVGRQNAESWRLRALAANLQGNEEGVRNAFRQGHEASGDKRKLFTAEASWHLDRGDTRAARYAVGQVQRIAPDAVETLFVSARFAHILGEHELAARAFLAILERSPTDRPALLGAIASARNIGRADLARSLVARGNAAFPGDIAFIYHTALLDADAGHWGAVRERLQNEERKVSDFVPARLLYGRALLELGHLEQARALVGPLYRRASNDPETARTWARILLASGENSEAGRVIAPLAARSNALPIDHEIAAEAARS